MLSVTRVTGAARLMLCLACLAPPPVVAAQDPPAPAPVPDGQPVPDARPLSERPPFEEWLKGVRQDALASGIRPDTVDKAFDGLQPLDVVLERDRTQAEFTLSIDSYLTRRLTAKLVRDTRRAAATHGALLEKVSARYGVPAPVIVSVWALESNLGRFAGVRPTISTLATLAWEGRRGAFFRGQLIDALRIVDRGDIELEHLKGSWAGAMGQVQFMPSSYLQYAVDFDGDGRRDIWASPADVFASIAHYLAEHGWKAPQGWGREVRVPEDLSAIEAKAPRRTEGCRAEQEMSSPLAPGEWTTLGVRTASGQALPSAQAEGSLLVTGPRAFLLYPNYEALLEYNCAHAYALSVGLLGDRISSRDTKSTKTTQPTAVKRSRP